MVHKLAEIVLDHGNDLGSERKHESVADHGVRGQIESQVADEEDSIAVRGGFVSQSEQPPHDSLLYASRTDENGVQSVLHEHESIILTLLPKRAFAGRHHGTDVRVEPVTKCRRFDVENWQA